MDASIFVPDASQINRMTIRNAPPSVMPQNTPITRERTGICDPQSLGTSCGINFIHPSVNTDGCTYGIRCFRVISSQQ